MRTGLIRVEKGSAEKGFRCGVGAGGAVGAGVGAGGGTLGRGVWHLACIPLVFHSPKTFENMESLGQGKSVDGINSSYKEANCDAWRKPPGGVCVGVHGGKAYHNHHKKITTITDTWFLVQTF